MHQFSVFTHLSSPKVEDYRKVLAAFSQARRAFVIHLRPAEVSRATGMAEEELEAVLEQLHQWGNLDRGGEAAERALELFEETARQPGELQTEALRDIIEYLQAIRRLLVGSDESAEIDSGKLHQQFYHLEVRFEEFTVQAQRFMQFLQSTIELHDLTLEDFIDYKDRLIGYLQRFVNDLITSASEIEQLVTALEAAGLRECFGAIARRARADALDPDDPEMLVDEIRRREQRWDGLRLWFLGDAGGRSQAETLRARAREAIPALLVALQSFHDRRESGSDRQRDWRQLARWFAEAPDDPASHRLWRVAFGMAPARHLRINEETIERREQAGEDPRSSWLDAEPMWLEPLLRKSGRVERTGRAPEMIDLSREREMLRRLAMEENAQIARAHRLLARGEPMWLSDFAELETAAFELLLDLLGRTVTAAAGVGDDGFPVLANSTDGSLCIELACPADPRRMVKLRTPAGVLSGPDYRVTIRAADGVRIPASAA